MIEQKPFTKYNLEKKVDTFTVKLNKEERAWLEKVKAKIHQPKDSTALKQLARVAAKVILDDKIMIVANMIIENKRKNKRSGIIDYEVEEEAKVSQNKENGDTFGTDKLT